VGERMRPWTIKNDRHTVNIMSTVSYPSP